MKQKKARVTMLITDKIDLKIKKITRDKDGHHIMIKGSIQAEDITIVNIYAPNIGASQYIRQTLADIKGEIDSIAISRGTSKEFKSHPCSIKWILWRVLNLL